MSNVHTEGVDVSQALGYFDLLQENNFVILQENNFKILIEGVSAVRVVSTPYQTRDLHTDQLSTVVGHVG